MESNQVTAEELVGADAGVSQDGTELGPGKTGVGVGASKTGAGEDPSKTGSGQATSAKPESGGLMSRITASADPVANGKEVRLSQEAYDRLSAELEDLTTRGRVEIARIIETARELGDLKENGDYHAAKEEQGKMEGRIRHLQNLLEKAVATQGDEAADNPASASQNSAASPIISVGSVVTLKYQGEDEEETYLLASVEERSGDYDLLSPKSPLGEALLGSSAGQQVEYAVAQTSGNSKARNFTVEVLKVG